MMLDTKKLREAALDQLSRVGMRTEDLVRWRQDAHPEKVLALLDIIDRQRDTLLGKPITEAEVKQALAQGRIERKIAEGDHAWRSLVDRNEALTQQLSAMTAARDELADIAVANTPNTDPHDSFAEVRERIAALRKVGAP